MSLRAIPESFTFSVVVEESGTTSIRGDDRLDGALVDTPALQAAIRWARGTARPNVSFLWPGPGRSEAYRVDVQLDFKVGSTARFTVSLESLDALPYDMTQRELEVLTLLVAGLKNTGIADRLTIGVRTVATHVDHILVKMAVASRTAAATIALDEGLLIVPPPGGLDGFERLSLGQALSPESRPGVPKKPNSRRRLVRRPLRLGAALPLLGETADDGLEMLRGAQLAIDEINARGGVNMRPIELVVSKVDHLDPATIRPAFDVLAEAEVEAVTSGYLGHQDLAHEWAAEYGRPYLNAATLSEMVRRVAEEPSYRRIFQVCPGDVHYAPRFVKYMTELRDTGAVQFPSNTLRVLTPTWPLIDLGLAQAAASADRAGWDFATSPLGDNISDWTTAAEKMRTDPPSAVLIGDYFVSASSTFVLRFLQPDPPPTLLYSLYAPSVPEFRARVGDSAEGLLWATVSGTYSDTPAQLFAERYRAAFGVAPGRSHAGISYDRVNILAAAWARAPDPRDFEAVSEEIRAVMHRGVNGSYWLGQPGQAGLSYPDSTMDPSLGQAHLIYQIQRGRHRIVSPAPYTEGTFELPGWM
ncbi:ABC transporter substrate-binding protein [Nocardioides sp. LHG3406-4]|uniref:ABC transporter substrate-binding protein n=1 Tax=Nocardioides sp. LHG3406-4 TaxID=2804575 RepID=UPI003CED8284